jgi:hypothetical protein
MKIKLFIISVILTILLFSCKSEKKKINKVEGIEVQVKKDNNKLLGGWSDAEKDESVKDVLNYVLAQMNNSSELKQILNSKKQIVNGTNYKIIFELENGSVWKTKVHKDLSSKLSILDFPMKEKN